MSGQLPFLIYINFQHNNQSNSKGKGRKAMSGFTFSPWKSLPPLI